MFCKNCGNDVEKAAFCSVCGASLEVDTIPPENRPSPIRPSGSAKVLGILGMIFGIIGASGSILCCWSGPVTALFFPFSIISLAFSIVAVIKSKKRGLKNSMAIVGLILSCIVMCIPCFWIIIYLCQLFLSMLSLLPFASGNVSAY